MTVKELIVELQKFPETSQVILYSEDGSEWLNLDQVWAL